MHTHNQHMINQQPRQVTNLIDLLTERLEIMGEIATDRNGNTCECSVTSDQTPTYFNFSPKGYCMKKILAKPKNKKKSLPLKKREFSELDAMRGQAYVDRLQASQPTKLSKTKEGWTPEDPFWWNVTLFEATGTTNNELGLSILNQTVQSKFKWYENDVKITNEALVALNEIRPQDLLEGMLASQMVATQNLAMECMRRSMIENQPSDAIYRYSKLANQYFRTFAMQLDALNKHRGKGQQKVTVEHVHVNEGGQAIVGNINRGGGQNEKKHK